MSQIKLNNDECRYFTENPCEAIEVLLDLKLDEQQKVAINNIHNNQFNVLKGSRGVGLTTIQMAYLAYQFYFLHPQEFTLVTTHSYELSEHLKSIFVKYLTQINLKLQLGELTIKSPNRKDLTVFYDINNSQNMSIYRFTKTNANNIRGCTASQIIIDCAAYCENIHDMLVIQKNINPDVKITLSSSPTTTKTDFYNYVSAIKWQSSIWTVSNLYWYNCPRHNENLVWKKDGEIAKYGSSEFFLSKGYKPTNKWYEDMCHLLCYNKRMIANELDNEFYDEPDFLRLDGWHSTPSLKGNFKFVKSDTTTIREEDYETEHTYNFKLSVSILNIVDKGELAEKLKQDFLSFLNK